MPKPKITSALLCDLVRVENSNKLILIGVYTGRIELQQFPATIGLTLFVEIEGFPTGRNQLGLRLRGPNGTAEITAEIDVHEEGPVSIPAPPLPVNFTAPGELFGEIKIGSRDWQTVLQKQVNCLSDAPDAPKGEA